MVSLETTLNRLKRELSSTRDRAQASTGKLDALRREIESFKIDFINNNLEQQRRSIARQRGFSLLARDKRTTQAGLAVGIGSAIFGGLLGKDASSALSSAVAGFDGLVRGLGESIWYVSLSNRIKVAPQDYVGQNEGWVTWASVMTALERLKKEASAGEELSSLDSIIRRLKS